MNLRSIRLSMLLLGCCAVVNGPTHAQTTLPAPKAADAQQSTRPPITGIAFMQVYTTHPAEAERFYGRTLGLSQRTVGAAMIFPVNHSQWIAVQPQAALPGDVSRMIAAGFTTTDAAGLQAWLQEHGVPASQPLRQGRFAVRDPEGNEVEFVQRGSSDPQQLAAAASSALPDATSHRLMHIGFIVHDRAKEDAFWRGLLGFRPYWFGTMHPGTIDFVSLQVPDGTDWVEYMMMHGQQPTLHDLGMSDHLSLGVDHMQSVLAQLQDNGCQGHDCTAIQAGVDGKLQLNLFDPDQTRVEFMEFRPVMKPCCSPFTGEHPSASNPE